MSFLILQGCPLKSELRSSAPSSSEEDNVYPNIQSTSQPGTVDNELHIGTFDGVVKIETPDAQVPIPKPVVGQKSAAVSATAALQPPLPPQNIRNKPKKRVLPQDSDSNFFVSPSPSLPATNPAVKRKLPILREGRFRSSLTHLRAASDNVTDNESWPPKRRKKMAEDINVSPDVEMLGVRGRIETKMADPITQSAIGNVIEPTRLRPPPQVNAVASSSKPILPDPTHRHAKPTNRLKAICARGIASSDKHNALPNGFIRTVANDPKSVPTDATPTLNAMKDTNLCLVIDETKRDGHVASSSSRNRPPCIFPQDSDNPFIATKPSDKEKTDTNSPISNLNLHDIPPRRIDLRESLNVTRKSYNTSSRTSKSSISSRSITPFILPEDQELINQVGFPQVMADIAKHYGFDVDVAKKAFFMTKSIEETESLLQCCKEAACLAANKKLAERGDVDSSGDEAPQSMRRTKRDQSASNSGSQKAKSSSSSRKANRPSLNFKLRPFDDKIDILSEYSPPRVSRAGQFIRLVKQGRREEAIDRERRRASGVFVAQTQAQSYGTDQRQQSLSLMSDSSPTLKSGQEPMDIDGCDDDGPPVIVMTPHKDAVQHKLPHDTSSQTFSKRISEGRSSLNDDPAVLELAQEHRDLVTNVTEENADALRSFEQKNNRNLLRLWSLDWARQKIAEM